MKTITALVYFYDKPSEFVTQQGENEYEVKNQVNQWVKTLPGYHSHTFEPTKSNEDKTLESLKQIFNMK